MNGEPPPARPLQPVSRVDRVDDGGIDELRIHEGDDDTATLRDRSARLRERVLGRHVVLTQESNDVHPTVLFDCDLWRELPSHVP